MGFNSDKLSFEITFESLLVADQNCSKFQKFIQVLLLDGNVLMLMFRTCCVEIYLEFQLGKFVLENFKITICRIRDDFEIIIRRIEIVTEEPRLLAFDTKRANKIMV